MSKVSKAEIARTNGAKSGGPITSEGSACTIATETSNAKTPSVAEVVLRNELS